MFQTQEQTKEIRNLKKFKIGDKKNGTQYLCCDHAVVVAVDPFVVDYL